MMSSQFPNEGNDAFESKREVIFEECSIKRRRFMSFWEEKAKVCDDARQYLEETMKELRIPLNAATLPFALDYRTSITKIQTHFNEVINTSLYSINRELEAKKVAWKQLMQSKYTSYREKHDNSVARTHQALLDCGVPALSRIEQALRFCSHYTQGGDELTAMAEAVDRRDVQAAWRECFSAARTEGYPVPRVFLPSKLSAGLELVKEGLAEMELTFENISASEPFEAMDTDWFSYSCLEPLLNQVFCGSLVSGVGPDGSVTLQLCEFDFNKSLTRAEVLELIVARLRYRLLLGDPTLRQLAINHTAAEDVRDGVNVAICRWNDAHPQIYRGQIEIVDWKARRCHIYLIDFGHSESFDFEEVYLDERCAKDLRSIPPLALRCHLHSPSLKLLNSAAMEVALRKLEEGNKGRFTFSIVAEHVVDEEFVWEIFVSDAVSDELQFPPPPSPPPPSPPSSPQSLQKPQSPSPPLSASQPLQPEPSFSSLTIKTEVPTKAPPRPKNLHRKNSSPRTPGRRKDQPSPKTPPVAPKTEPKTPPVSKASLADKPRAGPKTPPAFARHGRFDKNKRGSKTHVYHNEKSKSDSRPPPVPKANKPVDKPTEEPKTPPPPTAGPAKEKYFLATPPMPNSGRVNKEKHEPSILPVPNTDQAAGNSKCEPKTAAAPPSTNAAPAQKALSRAAATQRTPPGPRTVPVAKKMFRNTHTTWQKELVQSIVQNNSKRKERDVQLPATAQQRTLLSDRGDE